MTLHTVDFSFSEPDFGSMETDIDPSLDPLEKISIAQELVEIEHPDLVDIQIMKVVEV